MNKKEQQDTFWQSQGFMPDNDYECPSMSEEEDDEVFRLRSCVVAGQGEDFLNELAKATGPEKVEQIYLRNRDRFRQLVERAEKQGIKVPTDGLLDKLDKRNEFEDMIELMSRSVLVMTDKAYQEDGNTPRPDFVRRYWK